MSRRVIDLSQPLSRESQLHPFFAPTQILRHIVLALVVIGTAALSLDAKARREGVGSGQSPEAPAQLFRSAVDVVTIQASDGRWITGIPRPPIESSDITATALWQLANADELPRDV